MNDELVKLAEKLERRLANWRLPRGVALDEVINETLIRYWRLRRDGSGEIRQSVVSWLLGTAKNVKLELARQGNEMVQASDEMLQVSNPRRRRVASSDPFSKSKAWQDFSPQQRHVLVESLMFDRPVAEVAAEVQVNRSTAKSWIKRLPKRLANDKSFQLIKNKGPFQ